MTDQNNNRIEARKYFGIENNPDLILHHVDETLRYTNWERYCEWNPDDLVVMTRSEHTQHHNKGNSYTKGHTLTEEHKDKISSYFRGVPKTEEHNKKNSEAHKGKHRVYHEDGHWHME